jgi:hypothetical protein
MLTTALAFPSAALLLPNCCIDNSYCIEPGNGHFDAPSRLYTFHRGYVLLAAVVLINPGKIW